MTLTLLLDLDDTLLDTNMDAFAPVYFQALSKFLADQVPPEVMLPALMAGTKRMMETRDPARTLSQVFDDVFFPQLKIDPAALRPHIDRFYEEVFPTLSYVTKPRPAAVGLVDWAISQGYRVAIATNPLFPRRAIEHRLTWAGLPPAEYPFKTISSYERYHFTKSEPAYYFEVLGHLGWPEGPVLMVGDDYNWDILSAGQAGLPTYWIAAPDAVQPDGGHPLGRGQTGDLRAWLEATDLETLQPEFDSASALLAMLRATPAIVSGLVESVSPERWTIRPEPKEWCLTEIVCHLRDVDREVNLPRLQKLIAEDNPFIAGKDTDPWAAERKYIRQDGPQALMDFVAARMEILYLLESLDPEQWKKAARHAIFGPTCLRELVGFMGGHDRLHVQQIWKTIPRE
jgi:FMN phosphatase YigB (HAD superfamily)